jgi:hypothetical protein
MKKLGLMLLVFGRPQHWCDSDYRDEGKEESKMFLCDLLPLVISPYEIFKLSS